MPLRVQVFARGAADPAIEVAFTQVSFARPDAAQFTFNPPPGTTIVECHRPAPRFHPQRMVRRRARRLRGPRWSAPAGPASPCSAS